MNYSHRCNPGRIVVNWFTEDLRMFVAFSRAGACASQLFQGAGLFDFVREPEGFHW
jgi:hypothetical protein